MSITRFFLLSVSALSAGLLVAGPYAPAPGRAGSNALPANSILIQGWASEVQHVSFGAYVDVADWGDSADAVGPAGPNVMDILCLGDGGSVTLGFDTPIVDRAGADFAVFENGLIDSASGKVFCELAWVEVSSDQIHYVRFPAHSLRSTPVAAFEFMDPSDIDGLAGKFPVGYGVVFDLADLRSVAGAEQLDFNAITSIRIVDIVGDGTQQDADGRPIYDPVFSGLTGNNVVSSAGFDLDAVAVLQAGPQAQAWSPTAPFGWLYNPGMGWGWMYHLQQGWMYWSGSADFYHPGWGWCYQTRGSWTDGSWVYSRELGWLYVATANSNVGDAVIRALRRWQRGGFSALFQAWQRR